MPSLDEDIMSLPDFESLSRRDFFLAAASTAALAIPIVGCTPAQTNNPNNGTPIMTTAPATASKLLLAYLSSISDPQKVASLFAEDGVIELPYVASLGQTWRIEGRDSIQAFVQNFLKMVPNAHFENVEILIDTPEQAFGEYSIETKTTAGRTFSQRYAGRLVAANGQIKLLRESLDVVRAARAILPNGLADVPPASETARVAKELLALMGAAADPDEMAGLFSTDLDFEIAGDVGVLPWIGKKRGRSAAADFFREIRRMVAPVRFDIQDVLANDHRAVIVGELVSQVKRTGKTIETAFALVLNVSDGKITRFRMLEDSFAVSRAARA